jgi:hypothetical protein
MKFAQTRVKWQDVRPEIHSTLMHLTAQEKLVCGVSSLKNFVEIIGIRDALWIWS